MKLRLPSLLIALLSVFNSVNAQTVTLKQIGKETVLFSDVFVTHFNNALYTIENTGAIYKTDLITGAHTRLGNSTFKNGRGLVIANAQLFFFEKDGSMDRINISTGEWSVISPINAWNDAEKIFTVGNKLYATQNGVLYYYPTMNPTNRKQIGEAEFFDLGDYTYTDSTLHTIIGGSLYRIDLLNGKWKQVGAKKAWKLSRDGAVIGNRFYSIETPSALYETDLLTGTRKLLDDTQFKEAAVLIADNGKLYTIFNLGVLYEIVLPSQ
jgi:hypothetical protein